jgi:hypothetical protein
LESTSDLKLWFESVADQTVGREPDDSDLVEAKAYVLQRTAPYILSTGRAQESGAGAA